MNVNNRWGSVRVTAAPAARRRGRSALPMGLFLVTILCGSAALAHTPQVDANLQDWCLGAASNKGAGRIEDSSAILECGNCSVATNRACEVNTDCPGGQTCVNLTSKTEIVWWDNRTDGAVNDLGTVAMTQDNTNLYIVAELWVDPDPVSLPFGEVAIDFKPGGLGSWHDPQARLTNPGVCSGDASRACTNPLDCHFCAISNEPFPSTRKRACGSDNPTPPVSGSGMCSDQPGDTCMTNQTCIGVGTEGHLPGVGLNSSPLSLPDHMLVFDFSRWLLGVGNPPGQAVMVMTNVDGAWTPGPQFVPQVNPGASGGSGGPPGSVEVAIPWSAFGCTGCPTACACPGFGPGQDFRFTMVVARGTTTLDYTPDGPIEDILSESVAGNTTTSTNSCPGFGITTTNCELADRSQDAFVPPGEVVAIPGGRTSDLFLDASTAKGGTSLNMSWGASCSGADNDYEIYQGDLGNFYSHQQLACTTGGATSADVGVGGGNHYFLIVPTDGATEGSYGESSDGLERPASTAACVTRLLGNCP